MAKARSPRTILGAPTLPYPKPGSNLAPPLGPVTVGPGMIGQASGGKDYASMASLHKDSYSPRVQGVPSAAAGLRVNPEAGRVYPPPPMHHVNGPVPRPMAAVGSSKDYASLAIQAPRWTSSAMNSRGDGAEGNGGYGEYSRSDRFSEFSRREAGGGGGVGGGGGGASGVEGRGGAAGRHDRLAVKIPTSSPSPSGRDQLGRDRDWRTANGRRPTMSPSNGVVRMSPMQ